MKVIIIVATGIQIVRLSVLKKIICKIYKHDYKAILEVRGNIHERLHGYYKCKNCDDKIYFGIIEILLLKREEEQMRLENSKFIKKWMEDSISEMNRARNYAT